MPARNRVLTSLDLSGSPAQQEINPDMREGCMPASDMVLASLDLFGSPAQLGISPCMREGCLPASSVVKASFGLSWWFRQMRNQPRHERGAFACRQCGKGIVSFILQSC